MYTHEEFAADVIKNFEFLETDFGMRRQPTQVSGIASWVAFENVNVRVIVEHELGGFLTVSVQNLRHIKHDPMERSEFDLDEIMRVLGGRQPRRDEPRTSPAVIAKAAELLKSVGAPVLNGDFAALHERQNKIVEAVRKQNAKSII
jgi:hypothetical protein